MGWENIVIGYKHVILYGKDAIIPLEAKYLHPEYETRMVGWVSNLRPIEVIIGHNVLMPVYKKKNIKKTK